MTTEAVLKLSRLAQGPLNYYVRQSGEQVRIQPPRWRQMESIVVMPHGDDYRVEYRGKDNATFGVVDAAYGNLIEVVVRLITLRNDDPYGAYILADWREGVPYD